MQVSGSFFPLFAGAKLRFRPLEAPTSVAPNVAAGPSLRDFARRVVELQDAHKRLVLDGRSYRASGSRKSAAASSSASLGLSTSATSTTLTSTEEVNTTPTSYTPTSPTFSGSSTTSPTVAGIYSGENGDTTLTFTATVGGVVGATPVQFEVRDSQDNLVDTIALGFNPAGTIYNLSNGLEVSFSSGTVQFGDSFDVDVFQSVGSAVRPDNPFDGSGDSGAGFESGFSVGTGSFDVNNVSIAVAATDTLNEVLDRITASAAGVTASFDVASESVVLTRKDPGSAFDIRVGNDTSGFLAATKLASASSVPGSDDESGAPIGEVSALTGVQSGFFSVNGFAISVDILQDSLADIIERINESGAGVTASYDAESGEFSIRSHTSNLTLEDGTSGFLSAVGIQEGEFVGQDTRSRTKFRNESAFRRSLGDFVRAFGKVFEGAFSGFGAPTIARFRSQLGGLVAETFEDSLGKGGTGTLRSGLGIDYLATGGAGSSRSLDVDGSKLSRALRRDADELAAFLFAKKGTDSYDGLATALGERLETMLPTLESLLGPDAVGLNLDVTG